LIKLAIIGSKDFDDYKFFKKIMNYHICSKIISGGTTGADTLAKRYAAEQGIPIREFTPNWDILGKSAGFVRSEKMVKACDELVVFYNKEDKDIRLQTMIDAAEHLNKPVYKYYAPEPDITEGIGA